MPYIKQVNREKFEAFFTSLGIVNLAPGELNYVMTRLLLLTNPISYGDYNKLIGVLECCKLEFYRRAVANYEDEKIVQNGDVY